MRTLFWFTLLLSFASLNLSAQEMNRKINDPKYGTEVLIGYCDRAGLQQGEFGEHFAGEYAAYNPEQEYIDNIRGLYGNFDIVIVLGTWCSDSREQVPRFLKVLDEAGIQSDPVTLICVDGNKTAGQLDIAHLGIELVPTFIFYRSGEEIGRIVETPATTLEQDMWEVIGDGR